MDESSFRHVWDAGGRAVYDYDRYNQGRLEPFCQIDLRVDKNFYFRKWTLGIYVDVQNVTCNTIPQPTVYLSTGEIDNPEALPQDQRYRMETIDILSGSIVPSLGFTVEF